MRGGSQVTWRDGKPSPTGMGYYSLGEGAPSRSRAGEMKRGAFILFEGCDRAGKTTQAAMLSEALGAMGHRVKKMNFPGCRQRGWVSETNQTERRRSV